MRLLLNALLVAAALATVACGPKDEDRLGDNQLAGATTGDKADMRCTAAASTEAVKRELFRRASDIRGSNAENYARIAGFALLIMDGAAPTEPASANDEVQCRGRATLRLPPNLAVAGGRTSLSGTIGFTVSPGAPPSITLTDDEAITIPLATLTQRRAEMEPEPVSEPVAEPEPMDAPPPVARIPGPSTARPEPAPSTQPSFDCDRARSQSEYAVCANPALAALDRTMARQYRAAMANADPPRARLLTETRDRFLGFRNRCNSDDGCIAQTYRGRMREIDDIMAGRWEPR